MNTISLKKLFAIILFVFAGIFLNGQKLPAQNQQTVRLYGKAPAYSNYALVFETYQNFLNYQEEQLFTIEVDEKGHFDFTFSLEKITYAFSDLGQFRGFLFLEPGRQYEIKLPPFRELSQAQKLNPYFEPEPVIIGIVDEKQTALNPLIRNFDDAYNNLMADHALRLIRSRNTELASEIIDSLDQQFPDSNPFFNQHKNFRYARLYMLASRNKKQDIVNRYFSNTPVQFNMPAYWDTFKDVFKGFGRELFANKAFEGKLVKIEDLIATTQKDSLYRRADLAESLVLWSLYESYHEELIPAKNTLDLLSEMAQKAETPEIRKTASVIFRRINSLRTGTEAPGFTLFDFSGEQKSLADYRGKFVYLNFIHTENHACQKDLRLMPRILSNFHRDLEIVSVVVNEDYEEAKRFLDRNEKMAWDFLFFGMNANILTDYNVDAVPLYYLINPEGKIALSPAPAPGENFHDYFVDQYRKYQRNQQRKEPRERKSIFGP